MLGPWATGLFPAGGQHMEFKMLPECRGTGRKPGPAPGTQHCREAPLESPLTRGQTPPQIPNCPSLGMALKSVSATVAETQLHLAILSPDS